jgi:5-hydroxyisourate hydrolase-like protein (transthyretin family)
MIADATEAEFFKASLHMKRMFLAVIAIVVGAGCGLVSLATAQNDNGPTSSLRFIVLRDTDGKPVRNAEIVLHPLKSKGKQAAGEMELKTDADGRTSIDGIPYGSLRVQVLAPHFQTFGEDYEINKSQIEITVKLKHPGGQYSVYENHGDEKKPQ